MTMHTITMTKIAAKLSNVHWLEGLPASLASFRVVAQSQWARSFAGRHHNKALSTALSQSAPPFAMLVASDVSKRSCGLVP
jgi:hypothetical protein